MKVTKKQLEKALEMVVKHLLKQCDELGTCEVCPLDNKRCPFGDEFPETKVCRPIVVQHFISKAKEAK